MWRSMTEHQFPWDHGEVIVLAFAKDEPETVDTFRCTVGEHGAFFFRDGGMLSLHEQGWVPYAWKVDDCPSRDDSKFPPMWHDYLTNPRT